MNTNSKKRHAGKRKTKIKSLQARRQPVQIKNTFCMAPYITWRNVKYQKNILKSTPYSGHIKTAKPAPSEKTKRNKTVEFDIIVNKSNIMDHGSPTSNKKKEKTD